MILGLLGLIGWLGFWLVWDEQAYRVALGVAKFLDAISFSGDPLSRSFLTDETVKPTLFFVVLFGHILVPLGLGGLLWLHLARIARPRYLPDRRMMLGALGALLILGIFFPIGSLNPARALASPEPFLMDAWYLLPLWFTDRLGSDTLWAILLGVAAIAGGAPWWMARGHPVPAAIDAARCNACGLCQADCPYEAIQMFPRSNGRGVPTEARVDLSHCLGCGVCVGACTPSAVTLPFLNGFRRDLLTRLDGVADQKEPFLVAFACANSAAALIRAERDDFLCPELPGYHVVAVPCAAWLHPTLVEGVLRKGAAGVLVITCGEACSYREGASWTELRLRGRREPALRADRIDTDRVRLLHLDRTRPAELGRRAGLFREEVTVPRRRGDVVDGTPHARRRHHRVVRSGVGGLSLVGLFAGLVALGNQVAYAPPKRITPELVVSFKHAGERAGDCRALSPAELKKLPVHMRPAQVCPESRVPVRMQVRVDGRMLLNHAYPPRGLFADSASLATEQFSVPPGIHRVDVQIGDSADTSEWSYQHECEMRFAGGVRRVILFDRTRGFTEH